MSKQGWISLQRKILLHPLVCKDTDYFAVWVYLILEATHTNYPVMFNGKQITLKSGQLLTGRKAIVDHFGGKTHLNESKVQRILKAFENGQQIEQQTCSTNRLITILNYDTYQNIEQPSEQPVNNERTTSEHRLNTNNNDNTFNNGNTVIKEDTVEQSPTPPYELIVDYLNKKVGRNFKHTSVNTRKSINARFNEKYTLQDFYKVIDIKYAEWKNDNKMAQFLCPDTLFSPKFEKYLNQPMPKLTKEEEAEIWMENKEKEEKERLNEIHN